jgi:hypothetical protein
MASHAPQLSLANTASTVQSMSSLLSNKRADAILYYTHFAYPIVLLFLFIIAFAAHGIVTANTNSGFSAPLTVTGPGGKPLPNSLPLREKRKKQPTFNYMKRLVFVWLSIGQIATFLGNTANIVVHALTQRKDGWWCGEATAVSISNRKCMASTNNTPDLCHWFSISVFAFRHLVGRQCNVT